MALDTGQKKTIIEGYKLHEKDTGSPEVQVALLTERIKKSHRTFQEVREGPQLQARLADACGRQKKTAQLPEREKCGQVPEAYRKTRPEKIRKHYERNIMEESITIEYAGRPLTISSGLARETGRRERSR